MQLDKATPGALKQLKLHLSVSVRLRDLNDCFATLPTPLSLTRLRPSNSTLDGFRLCLDLKNANADLKAR